jgi:epoxyqueuosine reductase QueG
VIGYAHTLYCDRRGCRAKVTVESTRNAAHARLKARLRHGWRCDDAGDWCPADRTAQLARQPEAVTR